MHKYLVLVLLFLMKVEAFSTELVPIIFRSNQGQWPETVLFKGQSSSANILFEKHGLQIQHSRMQSGMDGLEYPQFLNWKMEWENSNPVQVRGLKHLSSKSNYFLHQHRVAEVQDVGMIEYQNLYPQIDLRYYSEGEELKHDYILHPGSDLKDIRIHLSNINSIKLTASGALEIQNEWGTILEKKPYSYQRINGIQKEVSIRYKILDEHTYGYECIGAYDPSVDIVLDPLGILWGTYVGGTNTSVSGYQYDIAVKDGITYATGYYPSSFPTSPGAYDESYNGGFGDVFVYALDQSGKSLLFSTFIGGSDDDRGMAIAVDESGVYVAGYTFSAYNSFPNTSRVGSNQASSNVFALKLNTSGSSIQYSAYIGSNNQESALDISVRNGIAVVVGETKSTDFPTTVGAFDTGYNGGAYDGFALVLDATGAMTASSFLGGSSDDRIKGVDVSESIYVTGYTGSGNFPTGNGFDNSHNGGFDAFVLKLNTDLTTLVYGTFLGGSYDDVGTSISCNSKGEAAITGYSLSANYPVAASPGFKGIQDAVLTHLNATGTAFIKSVYIGTTKEDLGTSLVFDMNDHLYVAGATEGSATFPFVDFPYTDGSEPFRLSKGKELDVFVQIYCDKGKLLASEVLGGSYDDYKNPVIGLDRESVVCNFRLGFTSHSPDINFPEADVYQLEKGNGDQNQDQPVIVSIKLLKREEKTETNSLEHCGPLHYTYCLNEKILELCDTILNEECRDTLMVPFNTYKFLISDENRLGCYTKKIFEEWKIKDVPDFDVFVPDTVCRNYVLSAIDRNNGNSGAVGSWSPSSTVTTSGTYTHTATNSCGTDVDQVTVIVRPPLSLDLGPDRSMCMPSSEIFTLNAATPADTFPVSYHWSPSGTGPIIVVNSPGYYCVTKSNACETLYDCVRFSASPNALVYAGRDTSICNGTPVTLSASGNGSTFFWLPGGQSGNNIVVTNPGTYVVVMANECGVARDTIEVYAATEAPFVNLGPDQTLCSGLSFPMMLDAGNVGSNYYWSTSDSIQQISISSGGLYFVTVTNGCGIDQDSITIIADPALGLDLGPDTTLCAPVDIVLNAGNSGASYSWSPGGETSQTISVTSGGIFSVMVTNTCGTASDNIQITAQSGLPTVTLGPDFSSCTGNPEVLTASGTGIDSYLWSTGATTSFINVNTPGVYWVNVRNSCGEASDTIYISDDVPVLNLGPDIQTCAPATLVLSSGIANTLWSTGATGAAISVSSGGIYWAEITHACYTLRDSVLVSIHSTIPDVNLGPDIVSCIPALVTLDAGNSGASYQWSTGENTQSIGVSTGLYSVIVSNGCGSDSDTIKVNTAPVDPFVSNERLCTGDTIFLDAGNYGSSYLWTPGNQTTRYLTVFDGGTYSVAITNTCGTFVYDIDIAEISGAPVVNLGSDVRQCGSVNLLLDAGSAGETYQWSTGQTTQTITVSSPGTYSVMATNTCGYDRDTVHVLVDTGIPTVSLGPDRVYCGPISYTLFAGDNAATYLWNTGHNSSVITVSQPGEYSVTATNSCGIDRDTIELFQEQPLTASLNDVNVCNATVVLNPGLHSTARYVWLPFGQTTQTISTDTSGIFQVIVSNSCGSILASARVIINTTVPVFTLGNDTILCSVSGLMLNAGAHLGASYHWEPGNQSTSSILVTTADQYSAHVTNSCGTSHDTIDVGENPISVNASPGDTICPGDTVQISTTFNSLYSYNWSPGIAISNPNAVDPFVYPSATTLYTVLVSDGVCNNADSVLIVMDSNHQPRAVLDPGAEGFVPLTVQFSDANQVGGNYVWDFGDGDTSHQFSPQHVFTSEDHFYVHVYTINSNGCKGHDSVLVKAFTLFIPNLISPNNDGKNDRWDLTNLHDELYVEIYNRWGDVIYKQDKYIDQWDGKDLAEGVYYFIVEDRKYNQLYKGWVQIVDSQYNEK